LQDQPLGEESKKDTVCKEMAESRLTASGLGLADKQKSPFDIV
jgi:hypothetical protein